MTLLGKAFMIMWHDISPEGDAEYHHWHTKQHMPERLAHTGFLRSRRGVNWDNPRQRYFTLYEGEELATFLHDDYTRSLNHPTEWTQSVAPSFRNFLRSACVVIESEGRGVGGALCTIRGDFTDEGDPADREQRMRDTLRPLLQDLLSEPLVCGAHLAFPRRDFSDQRTSETELRPPMAENEFDFVVIVESYGLKELQTITPKALALVEQGNCTNLLAQDYAVAFTLEKHT